MSDDPERIIGIHFDLKYIQPTHAYLLEMVRRLPEFGINTVLLEYEDKFPFEKYPFLRGEGAFTPDSLREFLDTARGAGLRVVPLVQTISHLEFALAHDELAPLREREDITTQICPSNPEAVAFVKDLLDEVAPYHEDEPLLHIGSDEAWHLGLCPRCAKRLQDLRGDVVAFWAEHVSKICRHVMDKGRRPIVWDDLLREDASGCTRLPEGTVINSWAYGATEIVPEAFPWRNVPVYREKGYDVIGSPCGNGGILVPNLSGLDNTAAWAKEMHQTDILGVINTMWDCFHTLRPLTWLPIAATGALCRGQIERADAAWQAAFFEKEFGAPADAVPGAIAKLNRGWAVDADLGRRLSLPLYGYTDMVAHYPARQPERRRRGAYPLDWDGIDFVGIYRKKLEYLNALADPDESRAKCDEVLSDYAAAQGVLHEMSHTATRDRMEAELYALVADIKVLHARVLRHLLGGEGDPDALREEIAAQRQALEKQLGAFLIPEGVRRMVRMYNEPLYAALPRPAAG